MSCVSRLWSPIRASLATDGGRVFPASLAWGRQASAREGKVKASELASRDRGGGWARDVTVRE